MYETTPIKIEGMSCLNCAVQVTRRLSALSGVKWVGTALGLVIIEHDKLRHEQLLLAIRASGCYSGQIVASTSCNGFRNRSQKMFAEI